MAVAVELWKRREQLLGHARSRAQASNPRPGSELRMELLPCCMVGRQGASPVLGCGCEAAFPRAGGPVPPPGSRGTAASPHQHRPKVKVIVWMLSIQIWGHPPAFLFLLFTVCVRGEDLGCSDGNLKNGNIKSHDRELACLGLLAEDCSHLSKSGVIPRSLRNYSYVVGHEKLA